MKIKVKIASILLVCFIVISSKAQIPSRVLVGYWQNWGSPSIPLSDVDSRYNVINISFVGATSGNINTLAVTPLYSGYSTAQLKTDITAARTAGKIVCLSIGGANNSFRLTSTADKNTFVSIMKTLIADYGVDGIDIDLENQSYVCMSGTIQTPTDPHTTNMIIGLQELLTWYQTTYSRKMVLTMAPETTYTTGGMSSYQVNNSCGGSYLPIIEALKNDIDLMMVQLYNSGTQYDLNNVVRTQGTVDFLISQTEAMIRGFTMASSKGTYSGLPASKIVVALPSCASAGSGSMSTTNVKNAIDYLMGTGTKPGSYTLIQSGGYPSLRGMMTWSINNDNTNCGNSTAGNYEYAANYESIFSSISATDPTITFNNVTKNVNDPAFNMTATSNSPGAISYSITSGNAFATINSTTGLVTINGAGSVTVLASQAANGSFNAGTISANLTISGTTGIWNSVKTESNLKTIPTVTSDETTLVINNYNGKSIVLAITDTQGKTHLIQNYTLSSNEEKINLNMTAFKSGMYFIRVQSDTQNETVKVIKQ